MINKYYCFLFLTFLFNDTMTSFFHNEIDDLINSFFCEKELINVSEKKSISLVSNNDSLGEIISIKEDSFHKIEIQFTVPILKEEVSVVLNDDLLLITIIKEEEKIYLEISRNEFFVELEKLRRRINKDEASASSYYSKNIQQSKFSQTVALGKVKLIIDNNMKKIILEIPFLEKKKEDIIIEFK